ncbi:DUF21 domain-containing protein [Candidatus Omnitrophota bacterium]
MGMLTWFGIVFCISQSALFSGLNLAFFSISKLRLEVEASTGNQNAAKVLRMRKDSNFILTTIIWGNVGVNVLLTLLSNSVLTGISAFVFSTVLITLIGEIIPQAYFSRHALLMASLLSPVLRFYQLVFYPVSKPVAKMLDYWLGQESIKYFQKKDLREIIKRHIESDEGEIERVEGIGAVNFMDIDDIIVVKEGEPIDPQSIIQLPTQNGLPVFPDFEKSVSDPFLKSIHASGKKWIVIVDADGEPTVLVNSDDFIRCALFESKTFCPSDYYHLPIVVKDDNLPLRKVIDKLKVFSEKPDDDVIDHDVILIWGNQKRVITGADILGRLLRGIARLEYVTR